MVPENINFCIFIECHYLDGEECTVDKCVFNAKLIKWWEHHLIRGPQIYSKPPEGMKGVENIYFDPNKNKVVIEKEV